MGQLLDVIASLLPGAGALAFDGVNETDAGILVRVFALEDPHCPVCLGRRVSYHSYYYRSIRDLPWQGRRVRVQLRTRRFRCNEVRCPRRVFSEQIAGVASRRARYTLRLS
jgi:transposase